MKIGVYYIKWQIWLLIIRTDIIVPVGVALNIKLWESMHHIGNWETIKAVKRGIVS